MGNKIISWRPWLLNSLCWLETWQHQPVHLIYGNKICHCTIWKMSSLSGIISINYQVKDQISLLKSIWTLIITLKGAVPWFCLDFSCQNTDPWCVTFIAVNWREKMLKKGCKNCARLGDRLRFELLYIFLKGLKIPVSLSATSSTMCLGAWKTHCCLFPLGWTGQGENRNSQTFKLFFHPLAQGWESNQEAPVGINCGFQMPCG